MGQREWHREKATTMPCEDHGACWTRNGFCSPGEGREDYENGVRQGENARRVGLAVGR